MSCKLQCQNSDEGLKVPIESTRLTLQKIPVLVTGEEKPSRFGG